MEIPVDILEKCHAEGVAAYPEEACGFISGTSSDPDLLDAVWPMRNIMNDLHEKDPKLNPRTARDGYLIDPLEQLKLERLLKKKGKEIKVIYHSHPDVGAYFSEKDKEDALWNGKARYPGVKFLVCGTTKGKPDGAIIAEFNQDSSDFDIIPINGNSKETLADIVGGVFGITGILPTIDFIHKWKNGDLELQHGYFRFVKKRQIRDLQEEICSRTGAKFSLTFCSVNAALLELLIYLRDILSNINLYLFSDTALLANDIRNLDISCKSLDLEKLIEPDLLSAKKGDVLLLAMEVPEMFLKDNTEWLEKLKHHRIPVIFYSPHLPDFDEWPDGVTYWITGISSSEFNDNILEIQAGIVLGNSDRQIAELIESTKRSGPVLSARSAAVFLKLMRDQETGLNDITQLSVINKLTTDSNPEQLISKKLCEWEHASECFLFPSGMSAVSSVMNLLRNKSKPHVIVIGLLYSDTYSLLMNLGRSYRWEAEFVGLDQLESLPQTINSKTAMIFTETITNPLLEIPDLERIGEIASEHCVPFVVDNTVGTPLNCQPLDYNADYVIHSTTKYLSGSNDHAGGAVLVKNSMDANALDNFQRCWEMKISHLEAAALWEYMQDFQERMERFNNNGTILAEFLAEHFAVDFVYHPSLSTNSSYAEAKKLLKGNGGVVSFTLKDESENALKKFYDREFSSIIKAPSIGSNLTLICPYTLLTNYFYTDEELKEINLPRYLIRISAGCETETERILEDLDFALKRTIY